MDTVLRILVVVLFTSFPSVLWAQTAPSGGVDARIEAITKCKDLGDTKKIAQCAADAAKGAYDLSRDEINLLRLALANLECELAKKASKSELGVLTQTVSGLDHRTTELEKLVGSKTSTDTKTLVYRVTKLETRSSTVSVGEFPLTLSLAAGVHVGLGDGPIGLYGVLEVESGFKLLDRALIPHLALALGWGGGDGRGMLNPKGGVALRVWPLPWDSETKSSYVSYLLLRLQYLAYDRRSSVPGAGAEAFGAEIGARLTRSWWLIDMTFSPVNASFAYKDEQGHDPSGKMGMFTIRAGGTF